MHFPSVSHFIAFLSMRIVIVPLAIALYRRRYLLFPEKIFAGLMAYSFIMSVVSLYLLEHKIAQNYLGFISTAVDAMAMGLMYGAVVNEGLFRTAVRWFGPVYALVCVLDMVFGEGRENGINTLVAGVECLLVVGITTVYLQQRMVDSGASLVRTDPMFLISVGLLLISMAAFPLYFFVKPLLSYSRTLALRAYDLMFLTGIVSKLLYAVGFWFTKRRHSLVRQSNPVPAH